MAYVRVWGSAEEKSPRAGRSTVNIGARCKAFFFCDCHDGDREGKFFFGEKPQTVVSYRKVSELVTEFVPSSCVVIEPTLSPCRHVRNLEIYPSIPTRVTKTQVPAQVPDSPPSELHYGKTPSKPSEHSGQTPTPPLRTKPQQLKTHSPFWGWNLFNPFRTHITHTTTKTEYVTTVVQDPHTVVSFYIRGCRPSRLPFNLPECVREEEILHQEIPQQQKSIVVMAPLKFVPTVAPTIEPSKIALEIEEEKDGDDKNTTESQTDTPTEQ